MNIEQNYPLLMTLLDKQTPHALWDCSLIKYYSIEKEDSCRQWHGTETVDLRMAVCAYLRDKKMNMMMMKMMTTTTTVMMNKLTKITSIIAIDMKPQTSTYLFSFRLQSSTVTETSKETCEKQQKSYNIQKVML